MTSEIERSAQQVHELRDQLDKAVSELDAAHKKARLLSDRLKEANANHRHAVLLHALASLQK